MNLIGDQIYISLDLDHASMSTQETEQEVFPEEEEFNNEANWDWDAEDDEFDDEIGEDFRPAEEKCKSLFLSQTFPSATQALLADKEATGFDFQQIRSDLSTFSSLPS